MSKTYRVVIQVPYEVFIEAQTPIRAGQEVLNSVLNTSKPIKNYDTRTVKPCLVLVEDKKEDPVDPLSAFGDV